MNYYVLNEFEPIDTNDLIVAFEDGNTIKSGCISIYEDSIGKPGDRFIEIKNLLVKGDKLVFEFENNEQVIIKKPVHIVINEKVIGVLSCEELDWISKALHLRYAKINNKIHPTALTGEHHFSTKENSQSFLFYTW